MRFVYLLFFFKFTVIHCTENLGKPSSPVRNTYFAIEFFP